MNKTKSKRIFYLDALRALAIISVINFHIFNGALSRFVVYDYAVIPSFNWILTDVMLNCFRLGVITFLMLSGALSLGRKWEIKTFLGRRIPRIVWPYALWTAFFIIIYMILSYFFNFPIIKSFEIHSLLDFIYKMALGQNHFGNHLWFFWMILGTYLIMPIFDKWIAECSLREVEYFLFFWLITCLFTYTLKIEFPIALTYFTGSIGFVVLGYYLRYTDRKLLNNVYFDILLILVVSISAAVLAYLFSSPGHIFKFERDSIFMALEGAGVFLLFKNFGQLNLNMDFITQPGRFFNKFTLLLAKYSYGIYLVHLPIIRIAMIILPLSIIKFKGAVVSLWIIALCGSLALLYVFSKIPPLRDKIGVK